MTERKEENRALEKELNKMETRNLPDVKFKTLVIKMFKELRGRIDRFSEKANKELTSTEKGHGNHK